MSADLPATADFVVVGGGIAGASVAYELAAHGRVVVLERETLAGYHSTGRSAALLTENYGNAVIRRLTMESRSFFEQVPERFGSPPPLSPRGVLFVAREDQRAKAEVLLPESQALVPSIHALDAEGARRLCPVLRPDYVSMAICEPDAMDLDVAAIHQGYIAGLRRRGGMLLTDAEVMDLQHKAGNWVACCRQGKLETPILVNAAGAWCDQVGALAGAEPIGLVPRRRTAFTFAPPPGPAIDGWPIVIDIDEQFYFKPESGRVLASPADETAVPPQDVQPEEIDIAVAVDRLQRATVMEVPRILNRWAGLRTFAPDRTPVVGPDSRRAGLFWLAGQGGYGIMTAPAMAQAAASLICQGRLPASQVGIGLTAAALSPARLQRRGHRDA